MLSAPILAELRDAVGADGLIVDRNQLQTYECDGLAALRSLPAAVVLPRSTAQLQTLIRICARHRIPFVGRGAGTGLSGGALPDDRGIVISFFAHDTHPGHGHPQPAHYCRSGRDQCPRLPAGDGGRSLLRA